MRRRRLSAHRSKHCSCTCTCFPQCSEGARPEAIVTSHLQCEDKSLGRDATAADPRAWRDRPAPPVQGSEQTVEESAATSAATIA